MLNRVGWLRESLAFLLLVVAMSPVMAQGQPFPTYKGGNSRIGANGAPGTYNPGLANLGWFAPSFALLDDRGIQTTVDNTDTSNAAFTSNWAPAVAGNEAAGPYWPNALGAPYQWVNPVPALKNSDNTVPDTSFSVDTATFTLLPADGTARDYAAYIHFPDGQMTNGATTLYQAKYAVVKVTPSTGSSFIDVIQVDAVGKGWVRIGNGGLTTAKLFHFDGTNPVTITLYNTIPRDSNGNLMDTRTRTSLAVYADAVRLSPDLGSFTASPTVFQLSPTDGRVISAVNNVALNTVGDTVVQGTVYSRNYSTGTVIWKWSPDSGSLGVTLDNQDPNVSAEFPFVSDVSGTPGSFLGTDFFSAAITNDSSASAAVGYTPNLDDGDYYIYFHTVQGGTYGKNVEVDISEDGGVTFTKVTIDMTQAGPWVPIGTRRYNSKARSLQVYITNYSADPTDAGKTAYADALKFEGKYTGSITSTPVQAKVFLRQTTNSVPTLTNVVLVATEQGKIYCLDANGNGDKTTKVYWTYPSSSTPDPNQVAGKDGVGPLSTNPTLYNLSSALVQSVKPATYNPTTTYHYEDWVEEGGNFYISMTEPNVGVDPAGDAAHTHWAQVSDPSDATHAQDRLYIGSSNGRIYCIDMTGRGDFTTTDAGTTARVWTYPDDYPAAIQDSALGAFKCSLAFATALDHTGASVQTIYAGTGQGRLYALDAVGDVTNRTTSVKWTYPSLTSQPSGAITSTPAIANGKIYYGTAMRANGAQSAEFLCLKTDSDAGASDNWGTKVWEFTGDSDASTDNFFGGPCVASAADLNAPFASSMTDTVYAANQNRYVYAFDAADGTLRWKTKELASGVQGPLTFSYLTVPYYDTVAATFNATATPVPVVVVPCENGHITALYANTQIVNRVNNGTRRAWEYDMADGTVAGAACGYNWMYTVDQSGYIYAFNSVGGSFGTETPPGSPVITENDPKYDRYVSAKVKLITSAGYKALRNGTATYSDINGSTYDLTAATYEYGQTLYALVYNYPYDVTDKDGNGISPPIANFNLSVEGATLSSVASNSQQIGGAPFSATIGHDLDGYAVLTFQMDLAGSFSLPPGNGIVQATLTSAYNGASQPYSLSNVEGEGQKSFAVANPIGLEMISTGETIGKSVDPTLSENKINGNPTALERISASTGGVAHGQVGTSDILVYDRSLMTLKRGPNLGLGFVKTQRQELTWRWPSGGTATDPILNPLPSWAAGFEDLPTNIPNTSRDYPDIRRDRIQVIKDPNGSPQNPVFSGVELTPPTNVDELNPSTRLLSQTPFRFNVDVPRYQPANTSAFANTTGTVPGGYAGQIVVFVDSTQSGTFDITSPKRSAYRTFYLATAVNPDPSIKLGQSVIDLKSLSGGAGISTTAPWSGGAPAPWPDNSSNPNAKMYQSMDVYNKGNVNLLNVRLAHGRNVDGTITATPFGSTTVDPFAWLDSRVHLYSDLDPQFWDAEVASNIGGGAPGASGPFAVKPRVGDRQPAKMSVNPRSRVNGNTLLSDPNWPAGASPKVTMVVPLGFPAGTYSHTIRVIEDTNKNLLLDVSGSTPTEAYSDPTAILKFKVAETRLTNGFSLYNLPAIDPAVPSTAPNTFKNKQPTGMRTPDGSLVAAWISDRASQTSGDTSYSVSTPAYTPSPAYPSGTVLNPQDRLYVAAVQGDTSSPTVGGYDSPLGDLSKFTPLSSNWFAYRTPSNPFPTDTEAQVLLGISSTDVTSVRMHHPSLPSLGAVSPIDRSTFSKVWLAVVGDAKAQETAGLRSVSRILLAPVTVSGGTPVLDSDHAGYIDGDDSTPKGKPSIVQIGNDLSVVFYSSGGSGQSRLNYSVVDTSTSASGKFASSTYSINLPVGFELSGGPSAVYREGTIGTTTTGYFDVSFVGKLSGRPNTEVFLVRLPVDITTHLPSGGITWFPPRGDLDPVVGDGRAYEPLVSEGNGVFRARGVGWDLTYGFALEDFNRHLSLIDASKRTVDIASGIVTYPSPVLGGQVYLDTNRGTVRFSSSVPSSTMDIRLSYRPSVLRLSDPSTAGHSGVSLVYDNHPIDDVSYWKDAAADTTVTDGTLIRTSRFVTTYNRAASGAGQAARPYWKTLRQGIQLNRSLFVASDGSVDIHVSGLTAGYYQVDPVKGRVYFADNAGTLSLEGVTVTVNYTALDQTTGAQVTITGEQHAIGLIDEMDEIAVPIDVPVNETGLATFFDPLESTSSWRRPSLLWMLWSSARGNGSDLYMQTVAPQLIPVAGH